MKPTGLKLNGKVFDPNPPHASQVRLRAWLDGRAADELFTVEELMRLMGIGRHSVDKFVASEKGGPYSHFAGRKFHLGNPRAIVALKKLLAENGK